MEVKMLPQMPPFYGQNEEVRQLITLEPGERVQTLPAGLTMACSTA